MKTSANVLKNTKVELLAPISPLTWSQEQLIWDLADKMGTLSYTYFEGISLGPCRSHTIDWDGTLIILSKSENTYLLFFQESFFLLSIKGWKRLSWPLAKREMPARLVLYPNHSLSPSPVLTFTDRKTWNRNRNLETKNSCFFSNHVFEGEPLLTVVTSVHSKNHTKISSRY